MADNAQLQHLIYGPSKYFTGPSSDLGFELVQAIESRLWHRVTATVQVLPGDLFSLDWGSYLINGMHPISDFPGYPVPGNKPGNCYPVLIRFVLKW